MIERILRRLEVQSCTGFSRTGLYDAVAAGRFPRPVQLSARAVGWRESEVSAWIESRQQTKRRNSPD